MAQFKTQKFTFFAPRTVIFVKKSGGYCAGFGKQLNLQRFRASARADALGSKDCLMV